MEFTVKRNSLFNELNLVQGVIEKKTTIPILSNILLEASDERLDITATDLDVSICCGCEADVKSPGNTTVSARRIFDIVRLMSEESEIHFALLENDWVKVHSGNAEYRVVALPRENFPSVPQCEAASISIPGQLLRSMIQRTMFAITQEESRYSLNGALLVLNANEMKMVATDGHRLAVVANPMQIDGVAEEVRCLVPRKSLLEILRLLGDQEMFIEFARDENHIFFSAGGKKLVSRMLAGQFPNYELVVPRDNDKNVNAPAKTFGDGIRRAAIMSDEKLKAVRLTFAPGTVEISASSAEAGEAKDLVPVEYEGPTVEIGFNPQYILDFLNACATETICISVKDGETQGMLSPVAESELEYRYVVMPMKF